jgi:hypothetical protein
MGVIVLDASGADPSAVRGYAHKEAFGHRFIALALNLSNSTQTVHINVDAETQLQGTVDEYSANVSSLSSSSVSLNGVETRAGEDGNAPIPRPRALPLAQFRDYTMQPHTYSFLVAHKVAIG